MLWSRGAIAKTETVKKRMGIMIRNVNEMFGDSVEFDSVDEMAEAIVACGYDLPADGLEEGRDFEVVA